MPPALTLATAPDELFPDLDLGDVRRNRRFARVVAAVAANPGASLPQLFPDPSAYHAALRVFDADACTHANILAAHPVAVLDTLEARTDPILLLHDATLLDFSGHTTLAADLGPIGNGGGTGWIAHQSLAVDPASRAVLGLVGQILHVRERVPKGEGVAARRARLSRESRLWERGIDEIGPTPAGCQWVDVCDRGADVFEFLHALVGRHRRFLVRSTHNRALGTGSPGEKAVELLHDRMRGRPATAGWDLTLPARAGVAARTARLSAAAETVTLRPPHVRRGNYDPAPLVVNAIRVWEPAPPAGVEPLEWLILTGEPIDGPVAIERAARWYACRMQIEEFHKVQKSGVQVEGYQLQSAKRMGAVVALMSVVAVGLMNVRLAARDPDQKDHPAAAVIPAIWVDVLSTVQAGEPRAWTVGEFWVALARLGGYLKNPIKHPPGWITLWRGWCQLHLLVRYHLSMAKKQ